MASAQETFSSRSIKLGPRTKRGVPWLPIAGSLGGRCSKDAVEELIELGAGEAAGLVAAEFPVLERADVDSPFICGFGLGKIGLFPGCFDSLGEVHGLDF